MFSVIPLSENNSVYIFESALYSILNLAHFKVHRDTWQKTYHQVAGLVRDASSQMITSRAAWAHYFVASDLQLPQPCAGPFLNLVLKSFN